jgi:hypothetical protein
VAYVESISERLERINKINRIKNKAKIVAELQANDIFPVRTVLQGFFDDRIKFLLPEGDVPYKPNDLVDQQNVLIHDARKLVYFVEGGAPNLKQFKREQMFIEMLETVDPGDAKMLILMKDKRVPWKNITKEIVAEAFPTLGLE